LCENVPFKNLLFVFVFFSGYTMGKKTIQIGEKVKVLGAIGLFVRVHQPGGGGRRRVWEREYGVVIRY
jgi:hypothetical protein